MVHVHMHLHCNGLTAIKFHPYDRWMESYTLGQTYKCAVLLIQISPELQLVLEIFKTDRRKMHEQYAY